jgi:hypothetical protein
MKMFICLIAVSCLTMLSGCMGGASKAETNLTQTCVDLNKPDQGRVPASVQNFCECAAKIKAEKCGAKCDSTDGAQAFDFGGAAALEGTIQAKCSK